MITSIDQVKQDTNYANVVAITPRFFAADTLLTDGTYGLRSMFCISNGKVCVTQASVNFRQLRCGTMRKTTRYQLWRSGELLRSSWCGRDKSYRKYLKQLMHAIVIAGKTKDVYTSA